MCSLHCSSSVNHYKGLCEEILARSNVHISIGDIYCCQISIILSRNPPEAFGIHLHGLFDHSLKESSSTTLTAQLLRVATTHANTMHQTALYSVRGRLSPTSIIYGDGTATRIVPVVDTRFFVAAGYSALAKSQKNSYTTSEEFTQKEKEEAGLNGRG